VPDKLCDHRAIDIDDGFDAHLSQVACMGEDVGGLLVAGFIDSALKKYDAGDSPGHFPAVRIKINELHIESGRLTRLFIAFGS